MVLQDETLATVADRELADVRTLAIGQVAPEISGQDIDGKPMRLSEFRGKVIVLDFGSHTHCGACRLAYPRLRALIDRYRGRPFVVLGVNNHDPRELLKGLASRGEVTWRCWWDGHRPDASGPIAERWNINGYPTFVVLDHRGTIRFKDLNPLDVRGFDEAIEALVKQAERR
jgi:peroxiredoxin